MSEEDTYVNIEAQFNTLLRAYLQILLIVIRIIQNQKTLEKSRVYIGANRETRTPDPLITNLANLLILYPYNLLNMRVFYFIKEGKQYFYH